MPKTLLARRSAAATGAAEATPAKPAATPALPHQELAESTDRLLNLVTSALEASPYVETGSMRVEAADGSIRIHGQVGTFFEKQMAQEAVRRLDGVERVENLIQVSWR